MNKIDCYLHSFKIHLIYILNSCHSWLFFFIPLADISEFEFNTAKRMVKRDAYETHKKAKQDELDNIRKQEQKMRAAEERAEMDRLRKEAVHKAKPVKHYKGVEVRPSVRPLTQPMSPRFKTDTRLRTRAQHEETFMSS